MIYTCTLFILFLNTRPETTQSAFCELIEQSIIIIHHCIIKSKRNKWFSTLNLEDKEHSNRIANFSLIKCKLSARKDILQVIPSSHFFSLNVQNCHSLVWGYYMPLQHNSQQPVHQCICCSPSLACWVSGSSVCLNPAAVCRNQEADNFSLCSSWLQDLFCFFYIINTSTNLQKSLLQHLLSYSIFNCRTTTHVIHRSE